MARAIIFDFDGVLLESVDLKTKAFAKLFAQEGEEACRKVVTYHLNNTGVSRFDKFRYIYRNILNRELEEEEFRQLCRRFSGLVMEEVINTPYVKGAKEFLDKYHTQYKFFVVSATPQQELEEIIRQRSMSGYFSGVFGAPRKKPEIVREILRDNKFNPGQAIYLGDSLSDYEAAVANKVNFIARINNNEVIFKKIACTRIKDLRGLEVILRPEERIGQACRIISSLNRDAYKDIFLISNQVLSKNPFTNKFLGRFSNNKICRQYPIYKLLYKLAVYYLKSLLHFLLYLFKFTEYHLSFYRFSPTSNKKELILIDTYFLMDKIRQERKFCDIYFSELAATLQNLSKNYAYLPVFISSLNNKGIFQIYQTLHVLRENKIPVLSEYQLLSLDDLIYLFYFLLVYPFRVLLFSSKLPKDEYGLGILKHELKDTLDDVTFYSFSRYLQGKRIAALSYENIKVISWYENQTIHKNLYKGLRTNTHKVKIYGAQLFLPPKNYLFLLPDENEEPFGLIPDKILVNGRYYIPQNTKFNYRIGPSLRYAKIFNTFVKKENQKNILVLLPYAEEDIKNILGLLKELKNNFKNIYVKAHPGIGINRYKNLIPAGLPIVDDDTYKLFATARLVVGTESGTLIEAASLGIPAIVVKNDQTAFYNNPFPEFGRGVIWEEVDSAQGLRLQIEKFTRDLENNPKEINAISNQYRDLCFLPVTQDNIIEAFDL